VPHGDPELSGQVLRAHWHRMPRSLGVPADLRDRSLRLAVAVRTLVSRVHASMSASHRVSRCRTGQRTPKTTSRHSRVMCCKECLFVVHASAAPPPSPEPGWTQAIVLEHYKTSGALASRGLAGRRQRDEEKQGYVEDEVDNRSHPAPHGPQGHAEPTAHTAMSKPPTSALHARTAHEIL
jgi:hypothetical protein